MSANFFISSTDTEIEHLMADHFLKLHTTKRRKEKEKEKKERYHLVITVYLLLSSLGPSLFSSNNTFDTLPIPNIY